MTDVDLFEDLQTIRQSKGEGFIHAVMRQKIGFVTANDLEDHGAFGGFHGGEDAFAEDFLIGIADGKVRVIVIVEKPSDKPVGFWDYAVSGMPGIIAKIGLRDTLKYMELSDKTEIAVKSISEPRWHLYFLAVDPKYQKCGIGSRAIQDLLIPLVKNNGGDLITVTTNSEKNVAFYTDNGFKLIKEETLEYKAKTIGNWSFKMDL